MDLLIQLAPVTGVLALAIAAVLFFRVKALSAGSGRMLEIASYIREGSMAFLGREFKILAIYSLILFGILSATLSLNTGLAFVVGAFLSLLAGYCGMQAATMANVRTAQAAKEKGRGSALMVAFDGGAVMGLCVAGLGIIGLGSMFLLYKEQSFFISMIHGFGVGASSIALFARVGGGIYTKAADVGADLAGKVIAGIPEDDPRNPGVIADNVGDNVGDVAGMGADIFESYVAATVAAIAIAATAGAQTISVLAGSAEIASSESLLRAMGMGLPLALAAIGLLVSIATIVLLRFFKEASPAKALRFALLVPPVIFVGISWFLLNSAGFSSATFIPVLTGAIGGGIIGLITDYYTSSTPVLKIAEASRTGAGTNLIRGLAVGLESVIAPMLVIAVVAMLSYNAIGLYGIALSAVAMLAVTAMVMTVDAYGPISDNAGGIAEMSEMGKEIREITDELDAVGNTTAAIGKGFAIGSAILTVIALFAAFKMEIDHARELKGLAALTLDLTNGKVLVGLLLGGILPCIVGASTMMAVGTAAGKIVVEIGRQFREIPGLLEGKAGVRPDAARCVDLATKAALSEMILPGAVAIIAPPLIGFVLGAEALAGALAGAMVVGAVLSLMMANAGGAWDNAKKAIEKGILVGEKKGSDAHKAAVVGDTVGDPFKDTSGPGIAILIKVMSVVSLMIASLLA
jgi:K(+)-stimulated pyrophosphate-energized sodium pump